MEQRILNILEQSFPGSAIEVTDTTGTQDHFDLVISSPAFQNKKMVEQHRMIYAALGDLMNGPIHALSIRSEAK